jgi:hypothetical protein
MTRFLLPSGSCGFADVGRSLCRRERVCRLKLLLDLASTVILRSESFGTRDHILLPQSRDFPLRCEPNIDHHLKQFLCYILCLSVATNRYLTMDYSASSFAAGTYANFAASRCIAMDYSGFQASCHTMFQKLILLWFSNHWLSLSL